MQLIGYLHDTIYSMYDKMNSVVNYTSSLTSEPFLYEETKIVAELRLQGYSDKEIRKKVVEDNIWGYKSIKQAKRLIPVVFRRMIFLDDNLTNILINGNEMDSKMVALYLVMKNNRLFSEFIQEVYITKASSNDGIITKTDIRIFFDKKRQQSKVVAGWKPYIFRKLVQVYINILFKSGLTCNTREKKGMVVKVNKEMSKYIIM
ncbi:DUF1819 family protein [Vallitalea guaymasensis]|uniref:DUF1819 family protein n=1 Tax=Vallitalea guaymasensis TaxID=1185412 RepID=UPI000DE45AB0|nr:DUF1819 family protein [Vallitalea guaymasensis]